MHTWAERGRDFSINESHAHESSGIFSTHNRTKAEQPTEVKARYDCTCMHTFVRF